MATSSSSSLPLHSTHSPTTSTSSESDLKHLSEKLDRLFGVKYVKELEPEEIDRRNAILTTPQRHAPTPALDISKLGVSSENRALHLPILSFSAQEILDYLISNLIKYKIITTTPLFSGGFARHCLVETSFNDLDIIFFIEAGNFDLIFHFFRNFVEIKLKALGAKLNFSSSKIFEFIESVYLYKKKIIGHEENLASLIGFGSIEFKFVLKRHYRYYVANYERFLVPIKHNSLFFAHPEPHYSPAKSSQALEDLKLGEFHVDCPEAVIDPLFRIIHATTNGFGIDFTSQLLPDALKKFTTSYPCTETASRDLMQRLRGHLDNHYPNQPEGQMVDFVNLLSLLQGLNKTSLYNHYITILAKALSCEREHGELKLRKGKKLEEYAELILPLSKMEEKCAKTPPTVSPQAEAFKLLSNLISQRPEISAHFVAFMQGLFFSEWCKKSSNIVMDSVKSYWQLGLQTSQNQCYYLTMPKGTLEELTINTLCSLKELNKSEVDLEQILRGFNISTFSFKDFISELLDAFESPRVRSLISLKILTGANPRVLKEFIHKEMPGYIDSQTLHLWHLQTSLQEYSRGMEEQTSLHLLIALLRHRIRHTGWQFSNEHFRQINKRLELLQNLPEKREISEKPDLKALLSSCFLALLAKIQPGIQPDFFLAVYKFQSLARRLKIFEESDHSKATAFIDLLHENFQHKETALIRGMAEALLPTSAETSQHEFCLYADILCSCESFQKERLEAVKVFRSLMTENFEERSTLMRLFCQILPNWRMVEESLSLFQEKMERKDFIQALYFNMKTQIYSKQPEAIERALITWLSNQPSKLNAIAHLLIGIKLLEIFCISKLEKEKKEHAETLMPIVNHLSSALKKGPPLIKNFSIKFPSKAKTELHDMLDLLFQEEHTHMLAKGLQKAFKEAFLEKAVIIPEIPITTETPITPEPPKNLENRNIVPLTLPNPISSIASKSSSSSASAALPDNKKKREFRGKTPRKWKALSQRTLEREWKETQAENRELNHLVQIAKMHRFFRSIVMGISRGMAAATTKTFFEVIKKTNPLATSPLATQLENKLQFLAFSVIAGMFLMTNQHRLHYSAGVTAITVTQMVLSFFASINLSISEEYSDFLVVTLGSAPAFMLGWDEIVMLSATVSALAVNLFRML